MKGTSLTLAGLSCQGSIMMPLKKNEKDILKTKQASVSRHQLLKAARRGDEEAIESLTLEDMDTYTSISKKIHQNDIYTIVDTYFMPYGVECDLYSIMGEILEYEEFYIKIKTVMGNINISGFKLELEQVTEDDICVKGKIESIDIERMVDEEE